MSGQIELHAFGRRARNGEPRGEDASQVLSEWTAQQIEASLSASVDIIYLCILFFRAECCRWRLCEWIGQLTRASERTNETMGNFEPLCLRCLP